MRSRKLLVLDEDVCTVLKAVITRLSPFGGKKIATLLRRNMSPRQPKKSRDGFWECKELGGLAAAEATNIGLVQCVVDRVFDRGNG